MVNPSNPGTRSGLDPKRILEAATRRFARYGFRRTSLSDIAADLGVVKGALYYYFPDGKAGIFDAVCIAAEAEMFEAMEKAATVEVHPPSALVAMTRAKLRWICAELQKLDIDSEVGQELAALRRREPEFLKKERALIETILQKGKADGSLLGVRAVRPTARLVQSLLRGAVLEAALGDAFGSDATGRLPKELFDVLLGGLTGTVTTPRTRS